MRQREDRLAVFGHIYHLFRIQSSHSRAKGILRHRFLFLQAKYNFLDLRGLLKVSQDFLHIKRLFQNDIFRSKANESHTYGLNLPGNV